MRILVISDTHISKPTMHLPPLVLEEAKKATLILHAGDLTTLDLLNKLQNIAEVKAVYGNMDEADLKNKLPSRLIFSIGHFRIGLTHGGGGPKGLKEFVLRQIGEPVDCLIFGHSHLPLKEYRDNVLLFNPGSPTDRIFAPYNSFGIIEINEKEIKAQIVRL
jgi:putative phosphoesterase